MRTPIGGLAATFALALLACGGGKTAVVGIGNSGNRIVDDARLEELADLFVEVGGAAEVSDALLGDVFQTFVERAKSGDTDAALVVLAVAARQREE